MNDETAAPQVEVPPEAEARLLLFSFTGDAREYFRIWIVNLFLSVITLGIYSQWAKVRKKRYFYGNTWVAGANFDYHGNPLAILKGRIVAVLALVAYNVSGHYLPRLGTAVLLGLMGAAPWLIVRSLQFNAVSSSYRNLRFHFHGRYAEGLRAIAPLLLSPLIAFALPTPDPVKVQKFGLDFWMLLLPSLPLVLFYPYLAGAIKRFQVSRSAYGTAPFAFTAGIGAFYKVYIIAWLVAFAALVALGIVIALLAFIPGFVGWVAIPFVYLLVVAFFVAYTRSRVANLSFNATTLGRDVRFGSHLSARKLAWIYFVNLLAVVVSCGLLVPWAVVRTARYRASCLALECVGGLESFLGHVARPVGATGDQLGEFFDVDLSL